MICLRMSQIHQCPPSHHKMAFLPHLAQASARAPRPSFLKTTTAVQQWAMHKSPHLKPDTSISNTSPLSNGLNATLWCSSASTLPSTCPITWQKDYKLSHSIGTPTSSFGHVPPIYSPNYESTIDTNINHTVDITHFVPPSFTTPTTMAAARVYAPILSDYINSHGCISWGMDCTIHMFIVNHIIFVHTFPLWIVGGGVTLDRIIDKWDNSLLILLILHAGTMGHWDSQPLTSSTTVASFAIGHIHPRQLPPQGVRHVSC